MGKEAVLSGGEGGICVVRVALSALHEDPANANRHDETNLNAISASLAEFGQVEPLVVQKGTGRVIGGNGRLAVMRREGKTHADVVELDIDNTRATALGIALNRTAKLSTWDEETLASLLDTLPKELLPSAGYTEKDLSELLDGLRPPVVEDEAPEVLPEAVSRTGDLWELGEHRLLCGDSTKAEPPKCDLVVTSPPYNCDIEYASHDDDMDPKAYMAFVESVVGVCAAALNDGSFVAWNVGVTPKSMHFEHAAALSRAGLTFHRQIVWAKAGVAFPIWQYTTAARKYHPNYCHEVIYLFTKGEPKPGAGCEPDDRFSRDVWTIHQSSATRDIPGKANARDPKVAVHGGHKLAAHPAAYPIGIPEGCIKHLTGPGEMVYEPFSGSGTTLIACEQLARRCYAIEIEPRYVDVAIRRWQKLTNKQATLNGKTFAEVAAERGVAIE